MARTQPDTTSSYSVYKNIVAPLEWLSLTEQQLLSFSNHIARVLTQVPDKEKRNSYKLLYDKYSSMFHDHITAHHETIAENIIHACHEAAGLILWTQQEHVESSPSILDIPLSQGDWKRFGELYGIEQPEIGSAYRGGVGRIIARDLHEIAHPPGDMFPSDYDMYLDSSSVASKTSFVTEWNSSNGYRFLPDFSHSTLVSALTDVDCTFNELVVTPTNLLISQKALQDLKSGLLRPAGNKINFFSHRSYTHKDTDIVLSNSIYRLCKFLILSKGTTISLPEHNILPENLYTLEIKKYFLTIARKIQKLPADQQVVAWYRFWRLGIELWLFTPWAETAIFHYIDDICKQLPWVEVSAEKTMDIVQEANWTLKKYVKLAHYMEFGPTINLNRYKTEGTGLRTIDMPYTLTPDEKFIKSYNKRLKKKEGN